MLPGDRLPSLRQVAAEASVNVNTVRAVYARLEAAGTIVTEQGRGTFVAPVTAPSEHATTPPGAALGDDPAVTRRALHEQIAGLEAELARVPAPRRPAEAAPPPAGAGLLSTAELTEVRDALVARLDELDAARAEVIRRLAHLDQEPAPAPAPTPKRSSSTLYGARVRWVGG